MNLSGARKTYLMLRKAGTKGVHSSEIRRAAFDGAGNPSERLREIADHEEVRKRRENRGRSPGVRAWLAEFAPPDAQPVTPAHASSDNLERGGAESLPAKGTASSGDLRAADEQVAVKEPVALVRDWDGVWKEMPAALFAWPEAA